MQASCATSIQAKCGSRDVTKFRLYSGIPIAPIRVSCIFRQCRRFVSKVYSNSTEIDKIPLIISVTPTNEGKNHSLGKVGEVNASEPVRNRCENG